MVQGYYTLQEAAQVLGMPPEELKQMAQKNQIRSFQDRGTWRFRVQDIQELARQRGATSDMELVLGEPQSGPKSSPPRSSLGKSGPKTPEKASTKAPDVFDFALDLGEESVGLGQEVLGESPSRRGKPDSKKSQKTPSHPPGSDSDVRLVPDGSDMDFVFDGPNKSATKLGADSNVRLVGTESEIRRSQQSPRKSKLSSPRKSGLAPESPMPKKPASSPSSVRPDSPVRLVPMDSDSDVKIIGSGSDEVSLGDLEKRAPTDSDIRLEPASFTKRPPPDAEEGMLTEEINLDEELKKQEAQSKKQQAKVKPKSKLPSFPTSSPFELSSDDSQMNLAPAPKAPAKEDSSDFDLTPAAAKSDSSDFDLSPAPKKAEEGSSDDFTLDIPDESDFSLDLGGSAEGELKPATSGISLGNPVDSGISLEQGGEGSDEIEFELSVDAQAAPALTPKPKPKPKPAKEPESDSSEFELSLEDSGGPGLEPAPEASDSSEFELTLDDSGSSLPSMDEAPAQAKAGKEKDIFETDFEVPGLEEESGSQVAALETDLDSSDFDLALDSSDVAAEDESGSQVVAVDEEEADEGAATVAAKRRPAADLEEADEDMGFEQLGDEETLPEVEEDEELPARGERVAVAVKAAPWGVLPVIVMLPCVVVMFLVGLMGLELVQNMTGYKPAGFLTKTISELVGQKAK